MNYECLVIVTALTGATYNYIKGCTGLGFQNAAVGHIRELKQNTTAT